MTKSTEVLEEVANDLIRMGDEIEQQISSTPSETKSADKTAPNLIDKTLIPSKQVSTDDHLKGKKKLSTFNLLFCH